MLRAGLIAVLLLGLGTTAMASDRVRVYVGVDSYSGNVGYRLSYVGGGRDYGRWDDRRRYDRRWHDHRWNGRDRHDGRYGRYYPAPRGYYYSKPHGRYHGPRHGYSRGYSSGGRHWNDRRRDGRDRHRH